MNGTDKGGNLPSRALGPDHYIPNKKQLSTPPSKEKKKNTNRFLKPDKTQPLSHLDLLLPDPGAKGQPCAAAFVPVGQLSSAEAPGEHQALPDKVPVPPAARRTDSLAHISKTAF